MIGSLLFIYKSMFIRKEQIMNKLNVKQCFKMAKKVVQKKSPEILTGLGIAGMITTVVLAVKATPKLVDFHVITNRS